MMPNDIPSAMELSAAANWNQTSEDWLRIMQLSHDGCRCMEDAGRIVATATLLPYGTRLGWIGMVLTRAEYRGQGLARRLMEDAIAGAERRGIHTLKLDATDEGRALYESLGFVEEQSVERWEQETVELVAAKSGSGVGGYASKVNSHGAQLSEGLFSQDAEAFGVSRKALLEALAATGRCNTSGGGYVCSRVGRTARYLGPCVASSGAEAQQLIASHLMCADEEREDSKSRSWYWDLLSANSEAKNCAANLGFTRRRTLCRMRRGEVIENNDAVVYAIAGFELG